MANSKRSKIVTLSKTKPKSREKKSILIEKVHKAVKNYKKLFVVDIENNKSIHVKTIRATLRPGRMFFGSNKVIMVGLGHDEQSEIANNIHKLAKFLRGPRGLICTDMTSSELKKIFESYTPEEYAHSGFIATQTVVLKEGAESLSMFPHSMENELRKLGLPTLLKDGIIHLLGNTTVCTKDVPLTVEAAQVLVSCYRMAKFKMILVAGWDKETGDITEF